MEKKIIDGIRDYYRLPSRVTDEEIEEDFKNSFAAAGVGIRFAWDDFKKSLEEAFIEAMPKVFRKYFNL